MSTPAQQIPPLTSSVERRFYPRVAPNAPVFIAFRENEREYALLLNVSENGLLISTPADLTCNFVARLSIPLNPLPKPVQVTARVIWASEDRKLAGIQLLDLSEHDRQRIRKWGTQESAQSLQPELDHPVIVVVPSATSSETARDTRSSTEQARPGEPHDSLALAPTLIVRSRPISTVVRLAILGASIATLCVAAALFFGSNAPRKVFARLTENRSQSNAASPMTQDTNRRLENPETSKSSAVSHAASLAPVLNATNSKRDPSRTSVPQHSPSISEVTAAVGPVDHAMGAAQTQRYVSHTEPISPESKLGRTRTQDFLRTNAENQVDARSDPSSTSGISAATGSTSEASTIFLKSPPLTGAPSEALPSFPNPPTAKEALPAPAPSNDVIFGTSAAVPSRTPSNPIVALTRPASPLKSAPPVVQPVILMDAPRSQIFEVRVPPGSQAPFFLVPGERVLDSPAVTMYIRRSVRMPAAHIGWPFNRKKKVVIGELISRVDPQAPRVPASSGRSVRVKATVAKDGRIENVSPVFGHANLTPAVVKALREWRYQPTLVDDNPVETQCYVVFQFHALAYRAARR